MCEDCGCGDPELVPVEVHRRLLAGNDESAAHNRKHFSAAGVRTINVMGGPGAGKTALLEAIARANPDLSCAALSGDLATTRDADRLRMAGIPGRAITTGSACHLDARLVHRGLHELDHDGIVLADLDFFFIENVGNLVCPAIYDLGQTANVVVLSVTEGTDKPLKYPVMFRAADLVVISKVDLLPHLPEVSIPAITAALGEVMPEPRAIAASATNGEGISAFSDWLRTLTCG